MFESKWRLWRWFSAHPRFADGLLTAVLVVGAFLSHLAVDTSADTWQNFREKDAFSYVLAALTPVPLYWRRSRPLRSAYGVLAGVILLEGIGYPDAALSVTPLFGIYSVGAHLPRRQSLRMFVLFMATLLGVFALHHLRDMNDFGLGSAIANVVIFVTAWLIGDNLRNRRALAIELRDRAERAEAQRDAEAQRAVAEERARIARELHDIVAHSMSVMVVQASGARRAMHRDPAATEQALAAIEATGRSALDQMRTILGVLRTEGGVTDYLPQPNLDDFEAILKNCRDSGLPVSFNVTGSARPLAAGLELSAYRIIQESLTNAMRHAGPARAEVLLEYGASSLTVRVSDDGRGAAAATGRGGHGIIGMRERAEAFGGSLHSGPRAGGGYEVIAVLPYSSNEPVAG